MHLNACIFVTDAAELWALNGIGWYRAFAARLAWLADNAFITV